MFEILPTTKTSPKDAHQHGRRAWAEDRRRQEQALHAMGRALNQIAEQNARNLIAASRAFSRAMQAHRVK